MTRAREESGFALVTSVIIIFILLGLGIALLKFTDTQQKASTFSQSRESAYAVAEAALNSQIYQLSLQWPTAQNGPHPSVCTPSTGTTTGCPDPTGLSSAYPNTSSSGCPSGTPSDAWGQSITNQWETYVRADGPATSQTSKLFSSTVNKTQDAWDDGGSGSTPDGALWVRAVGVANCRTVSVISKVAVQYVPLNFPQDALLANAFATSNNGNKIIVITNPVGGGQPGPIAVRCNGLAGGPPWPDPGSACTNYRSTQVSPDTTGAASSSTSTTLTSYQLDSLRLQAKNNNTYWASGNCPSSVSQLTGNPTFIEGPCSMSFTNGGPANSASSPGFLVINKGSIEFNGPVTFYGVIYGVNTQGATGAPCSGLNGGSATTPSDIVWIHGTALVQGAIDVDGNGTVCFGSSAANFTYDKTAFSLLKGWGGAEASPNTFRVLPDGQ
jgi:type II secretory pathway pseudopilin PulG